MIDDKASQLNGHPSPDEHGRGAIVSARRLPLLRSEAMNLLLVE